MKLRIFLIVLSVLLILPIGAIGLLSSEASSHWLLQQILPALPGTTSVKTIEGRLIDRIELAGLQYRDETQSVAIDRLIFDWNAKKLLQGTLEIEDFTAQGIRVHLAESQKEEPSAPFQLPDELALPIQIVIQNVLLSDVELVQGDQSYRLDRLQLSARTENGVLTLAYLKLDAKPLTVNGRGKITLGQGYPLHLNIDWRDLQWPLAAAQPQVRSEQGALEVSGLLTDYRIALSASLAHPELPESGLTFRGRGNLESMLIETLELKPQEGLLQLKGNVSWKDVIAFDVNAAVRNFNPAIVLPDLPGRLTLTTRLKGKVAQEALELDADIEQLTGKLRGYPLEGGGKLRLSGNRLEIDKLRLVSGANRLSADGTLEPKQSDFKIDLNAPHLEQLWPELGGSLKVHGLLHGGWQNPIVKLQATGRRLLFAEHQAERLAVDIDYHPEAKQVSKIDLSASAIKSGALQISSLIVKGEGTRPRHQLTAAIRSSQGDLNAALAGSLKDATWKGSLSRLDFKSPGWGHWRLAKNMDITISQQASGIDALISESCLIRQESSLCAAGHYRAAGDFIMNLKMAEVPLSLAQHALPKGMTVRGHINGEANVQSQRSVMTGQYWFTLPAGSAIRFKTEQETQQFVLGASSLSGNINGDIISSELDLALPGRDYARGNLRLNTGKKPALSGQITASVVEFDWIKPFVPQLTDIKADLKADLTLAGTPAKPEVHGVVRLSDGALGIAGHRIDAIQVEAVTAEPSDRVRIRASARADDAPVNLTGFYLFDGDYQFALNAPSIPLSLAQPYLPEQLEIDGMLQADAEIRQKKGSMTGTYRVNMPAGTRIIAKTLQPAKRISLGTTQLSGTIDNNIISADLDMALAGKDFVRGQLRLDTGGKREIDGSLNASVVELALVESFVPQLANLKGRLLADVDLQGTVEQPVAQGSAGLTNGSVDVADLGLNLRKISLEAATTDEQGRRLRIQGFAQSGQGVINMDGFALLEPGFPVELTLIGEKFEAAKLPEAEVSVSPTLKIAFGHAQGNITGKVKVANAHIELKELPAGSVKVSEDEIIVGQEKSPEEEAAAAPVNINANIEVDLGKDTHFSGFGLETDLTGKLQIVQKDQKMRLHGNVDMKDATYKSYGQDL
ncbi:MAG: translocation/assembly module TamB domain-containing protein, partial [Methylosarcina sp.]